MVHFYGNVEVGRDIAIDELLGIYDAVVIAAGAPRDRPLGIPGEDLPGVYGSSAFVGWYNGHPDFRDLNPRLSSSTVVIGNGNVALDVARVLVKTPAEMASSDIPEYALETIAAACIRDVHVLGRRGVAAHKFAPAEMREIARLADCTAVVDPAELPDDAAADDKVMKLFRSFAASMAPQKAKHLYFHFSAAPEAIIGTDRVEGLRYRRTRIENGRPIPTDSVYELACGTVITAIGYRASPLPGVPFDIEAGRVENTDGHVAPRLYAVGWAKRGPTGVIGSNKPDGEACAAQILADLAVPASAAGAPGPLAGQMAARMALQRLLDARHIRYVTLDDWRLLDSEEVTRADGTAPRRKFTSFADMLAVLAAAHRQRLG